MNYTMDTTNWTDHDLEDYTSSFVTPSASSGSSGSIPRSIMDGDENMMPGNFGYGEADLSYDMNYFNETTEQMSMYQNNGAIWDSAGDGNLDELFPDAELKLEPNNEVMPLAISPNQSSQPSGKVHKGKSFKNRPVTNRAPNRRYKCPGCDMKFSRMADLQRHERHVHPDEHSKHNIVCDYVECSRNKLPFSRKDHYREHLRDSHGEDMTKRGGNVHKSSGSPRNIASSAGSGKGSNTGDKKKGKAVRTERAENYIYYNCEHGDAEHQLFDKEYCDNGIGSVYALDFNLYANGESSASGAIAERDENSDLEEERLRNCIVDLSWWRCSRCLQRVPRMKDDPKLDWTCVNPTCNVSIEPIRKLIREEMAEAAAAAAASAGEQGSSDGDVKLWGDAAGPGYYVAAYR